MGLSLGRLLLCAVILAAVAMAPSVRLNYCAHRASRPKTDQGLGRFAYGRTCFGFAEVALPLAFQASMPPTRKRALCPAARKREATP